MFLFGSQDIETGASVVVEDNGRVCYAYFRAPDGQIVGDVWLYNRCEAPEELEWGRKTGGAPYANARDYIVSPMNFALPTGKHEVSARWLLIDGELIAEILVGDLVIGRLGAGHKPGWARAAAKNGRFAQVMLM